MFSILSIRSEKNWPRKREIPGPRGSASDTGGAPALDKAVRSASDRVQDFLSSIRLTLFLCLVLASVSIVGTVIPQNGRPADYVGLYGQTGARILEFLGFTDLYHSPGFVLLLSLLGLNLVMCTAKRFPHVWRSLRRDVRADREPSLDGWKNQDTLDLRGDPERVAADLDRALRRLFGNLTASVPGEPGDGRSVRRFERNRYSRLGPYIAHASLLLILLGGLVGALFGFQATLVLHEGEESSTVWMQEGAKKLDLGFGIRCNRFVLEHYPDGSPREYRSEVTLSDPRTGTTLDGAIRVNHPLSFRGITFYQATYGSSPRLVLEVEDRQTREKVEIRTGLHAPFLLPGGRGERAVVVDFREQLVIPAEMMRMTSFPREDLGPAARISVVDDKGFQDPFWILQEFPDWDLRKTGPYRFRLLHFDLLRYTGLQVSRDPGTPLVWAGCILLVLGFLLSLLMDHEVTWVIREDTGKGEIRVRIASRAVRHPLAYEARFAAKKDLLRKRLTRWLGGPKSPEGASAGRG